MIEDIKNQITKIRDNEYSGENAEALRQLDLDDLKIMVERVEDVVENTINTLDNLR